MIKFIRTSLLLLSALTVMPVAAQDEWQANSIHPKRCGTSMILEREAKNGTLTRAISQAGNYVPHTGSVTIPVILVNFKDVKFSINSPKEAFNQFFNGETQNDLGNGNDHNFGSVKKYFLDMSGGNFDLSFKVYGPVTLDSLETYYGGKHEDNDDEKPQQLVSDAIAKLQASSERITDLSEFCSDGKTIDCVYIVYAGQGQNDGGQATSVWANTGSSSSSINNTRVRWYSMAGELGSVRLDAQGGLTSVKNGITPCITGVGVTCHELTHALGFPDIYPTTSSAHIDNQEMEYWDLMDGGEYTYYGFRPTAYTAFEKSEMGWPVDIKELTESQAVSIATSTEQGGTAYKIVNPDNSNEYIMLECIQKRGWNRYLFGNGLFAYHVNIPTGDITLRTPFNNTPNYPGMAIIPADGACLSSYIDSNTNTEVKYTVNNRTYTTNLYTYSLYGDLFPGTRNMPVDTLNVTELSDANPQPNFCWYNSAKTQKLKTNKALQNIKYDTETGAVSFYYIHDVATGIKNVNVKPENAVNNIYTIDGRYIGNNLNSLPHGIYIVNGRKVVR